MMTAEFRLLGGVEVWLDGHQLDIGPARQRCLLAVLLVEANTGVSVDQLIDRVWADNPPLRARGSVYTYLTRLRRALEATSVDIARRASGYVLSVDDQAVDLHLFRDLVSQARAAADDEQALVLIEQALRLWRGEAFTGLDTPWLQTVRTELERERLDATHLHIDLMLRSGQHDAILPTLSAQLDQHPLDERLAGQLMLALYRSGRKADALRVFHDNRRALAGQLGIEQGVELRELHERILRADPDLATVPKRQPDRRSVRRNGLPGDIADFTGRTTELDRLLSNLNDNADAVTVAAIDGMAGIGKTTLAVHIAHRLTDRYPDAQLFVDLHGYSAGHDPVDPAAALNTLLRMLGVPVDQIPDDVAARSALWRSELAGRNALVVLDNAASASQVRPLLPGTAGGLALVTSRRRLLDLEASHNLSLDVLPHADAISLIWRVLGDGRVADEPQAADELVELCGYLPLALRLAAARLRTRRVWTVAHLAARLREGQRVLTELTAGDRNVAAAFTLSYQHLPAAQQRLFRLLGLVPGPDVDATAAAALAGIDPSTADELLEELVDVHLLQQSVPGRYHFHDLLRHHAEHTARQTESEADCDAALHRLVNHYVHTARAADTLLFQPREPIQLRPPAIAGYIRGFADQAAALAWFDAENANLLAVQRLAVDRHWHTAVWQLAWVMDTFQGRRGLLRDHLEIWRAGLAATEQLDDLAAQALAHRLFGRVNAAAGRSEAAMRHLKQALTLAERTGELPAQARTHSALAWSFGQQGDDRRALEHSTYAMRLYQLIGAPEWEARTRSAVGWYQARLGEYAQARANCEQALPMHHGNDPHGEAHTLENLGYIAQRTGRHVEARDYYQQSASQFHTAGNNYGEADALDKLARAYADLGDNDKARIVWRQALELYQAQRRTADADRVRRLVSAKRSDL